MPSKTPFAISVHNLVEEDEFMCGSRFAVDGSSIDQSGLCLMGERDALRAELAEAKAQIAASVTRDVAIDACNRAWGHGRLRFAGGGHVEHPVDPRRIFTHDTPESNAGEYAEARACSVACLARAEAEAATNAARAATIDQTPKEGTDK